VLAGGSEELDEAEASAADGIVPGHPAWRSDKERSTDFCTLKGAKPSERLGFEGIFIEVHTLEIRV